jgi:hypothetical protein
MAPEPFRSVVQVCADTVDGATRAKAARARVFIMAEHTGVCCCLLSRSTGAAGPYSRSFSDLGA